MGLSRKTRAIRTSVSNVKNVDMDYCKRQQMSIKLCARYCKKCFLTLPYSTLQAHNFW